MIRDAALHRLESCTLIMREDLLLYCKSATDIDSRMPDLEDTYKFRMSLGREIILFLYRNPSDWFLQVPKNEWAKLDLSYLMSYWANFCFKYEFFFFFKLLTYIERMPYWRFKQYKKWTKLVIYICFLHRANINSGVQLTKIIH